MALLGLGAGAGVALAVARLGDLGRSGAHRIVASLALGWLVVAIATEYIELPIRLNRNLVAPAIVIVVSVVGVFRATRAGHLPERAAVVGGLMSLGGVFLAVPENSPAVAVVGLLVAVVAIADLSGWTWDPLASAVLSLIIAWAALAGAVERPPAMIGGVLCLGLAPWLWLASVRSIESIRRLGGMPTLVLHGVIAVVAARWIAVQTTLYWERVAAVVVAAAAASVAAKWGTERAQRVPGGPSEK